MWNKLAHFILNYRRSILAFFLLSTLGMAFFAKDIKLSYAGSKILPLTDSSFVEYNRFKQQFGEDGNTMVLGIQSEKIFEKDTYNQWVKLSNDIKAIPGIQQVLSTGHLFHLAKDTVDQKFVVQPIPGKAMTHQHEVDSLKSLLQNTPFFKGLIYTPENATLMAISFDTKILNTIKRNPILQEIEDKALAFQKNTQIDVHISGMPYIRTAVSKLVSKEFALFLGLSILISAIILFIFFRRFSAVLYPILVVVMGVIWSVGMTVLFGYELTILTGLIPPLIVIIGIPNSILILNKYYAELYKHGEKRRALEVVIEKIGITTLIANITAAIGFGVLWFTGSELLMQFGAVASINVMITWLLSLCLIPIIFSYLPEPKLRARSFNGESALARLLKNTNTLVQQQPKKIYLATIGITIIAAIGISRINVNGYVVDDLPSSSNILRDLHFFEKNFKGILPLEVSIDTKRKNGALSLSNLKKVDRLEQLIAGYPEFSKAISVNAGLKYATQTFYNGDSSFYRLPTDMEKNFVLIYISNGGGKGNGNLLNNILDKDKQKMRLTFQMADVGSKKLDHFLEEIKPRIDSIFNPKRYEVLLTGSSIIFSKGTNYMLHHLMESIALAIFLISLVRYLQFRSIGIMFISLLPNIVPLLITAGIMGAFGLALKPSTILIFTIAFGLASDQTIYFLTRFQQELQQTNYSIPKVIADTIKETGVSMTHIALILFFGFGIFAASTFGGTVILGILLSITLLVALIFNLTLLPALVLWLYRKDPRIQAGAQDQQDSTFESDH